MATLAEYEAALDACVANPTPALAAAAAAKHAVLAKKASYGTYSSELPELPTWVKNLADQHAPVDTTSRIIIGRTSFGDGR